ncbi:hypothetical protein [Fructobacillus tropaeoli]|uniref:hypothetical protein n=1 Tax=Fructobacillus tropaeoli TaxID=709323 RepID=UPI001941BB69|nr:hypothetical protein [Fructobacillus tropaeoli]GIC69612.1 hypothetical protein FT12353_02490 [Fructobacillus tropaeoli]
MSNTKKIIGLAAATAALAGVAASNTTAHADDTTQGTSAASSGQTGTSTQTKAQAQAAVDTQQKVVDSDQQAVDSQQATVNSAQQNLTSTTAATATANSALATAKQGSLTSNQQSQVATDNQSLATAKASLAQNQSALTPAQQTLQTNAQTVTDLQNKLANTPKTVDGTSVATPTADDGGISKGETNGTINSQQQLPLTLVKPANVDQTANNDSFYGWYTVGDGDTSAKFDVTNQEQLQELRQYAMTIVNSGRASFGVNPVSSYAQLDTNMQKKTQLRYQDPKVKSGYPHYMNIDYLKGIGFIPSTYSQDFSTSGDSSQNPTTMLQAKVWILNVITAMVYQDGSNQWGHRDSLMGITDDLKPTAESANQGIAINFSLSPINGQVEQLYDVYAINSASQQALLGQQTKSANDSTVDPSIYTASSTSSTSTPSTSAAATSAVTTDSVDETEELGASEVADTSTQVTNPTYTDLQNQIILAQQAKANVQTTVDNLNSTIASLNQQISDLQNKINSESNGTADTADVAAKQKDLETAQANQAQAQSTLDAAQSKLTDLQKQLSTDTDDLKSKQALLSQIEAIDNTSATGGSTSGGTSTSGESTNSGTSTTGGTTNGGTSTTGGSTNSGTSTTSGNTTSGASTTGGTTNSGSSTTGESTNSGISTTGSSTSANAAVPATAVLNNGMASETPVSSIASTTGTNGGITATPVATTRVEKNSSVLPATGQRNRGNQGILALAFAGILAIFGVTSKKTRE